MPVYVCVAGHGPHFARMSHFRRVAQNYINTHTHICKSSYIYIRNISQTIVILLFMTLCCMSSLPHIELAALTAALEYFIERRSPETEREPGLG